MGDSSTISGGTEADLKGYNSPAATVTRWLKEIKLVQESRRQKSFEAIGEKVLGKYRNSAYVDNYAPNAKNKILFNVLWSNTQVLEPALYSRMPKCIAERVFKDSDPLGRLAAKGAERATQFELQRQQDRFNYVMKSVVQDRLLPGRGQAGVCYKTDFEEAKDQNGEPIVGADGMAIKRPKPNTERVEVQHWNYLDYLESLARTQYEVRWRANRIYKTRAELTTELGEEIGKAVKLSGDGKKKKNDEEDFLQQAEIWVVQDLTSKKLLWICEGYPEAPLKEVEDPYKLKDFWNCPLPLDATTTTDSTYPTADYVIYEGLADEHEYVTKRLKAITETIRLVGVIAKAHAKDIKNMTDLPDGTLKGIDNFGTFAEKGGLKGVIDWLPFDNSIAALPALTAYQGSLKSQIDEITSMPDIVRGSSDPNDPVYSQQQKSHWTVIKLVKKQQDVQRFCRELISKMAELIFEPGLFSDETINLMAGVAQMSPEEQEMWPEALQLLRDDKMRTFRVDIETDSTIAIDEDQTMQRWMQYLSAMKDIVGEVQGISQYRPELMQPMVESALAAVRTLRTGRSVEGAWERAFEQIEANDKAQAEQAAQNPPPPDYEAMKAQNEQARTQVAQMEAQNKGMEFQAKQAEMQFSQWEKSQRLELDQMKAQSDFQLKSKELDIKAAGVMSREEIDRMDQDLQTFKVQLEQALNDRKQTFAEQSKALEMREKLMEEARLSKQDQLEEVKVIIHDKQTERAHDIAERAASRTTSQK